MKSWLVLTLLVACIGGTCAARADIIPTEWTNSNWSDVDKEHSAGSWGKNYISDSNGNGRWDYGEEWADNQRQPSWIRVSDNSCWMASAAAMLSLKTGRDGQELYSELIGYSQTDPRFRWDQGGYQSLALTQYIRRHKLTEQLAVTSIQRGTAEWTGDMLDYARQRLYAGDAVGIDITWPGHNHALTMWGWTESDVVVADSDQGGNSLQLHGSQVTAPNWSMLFSYPSSNPQAPTEVSANVYLLVTLSSVPEPTALLSLLAGAGCLLRRRRRSNCE